MYICMYVFYCVCECFNNKNSNEMSVLLKQFGLQKLTDKNINLMDNKKWISTSMTNEFEIEIDVTKSCGH